jgi:penicillin-binding protein 1C
LLINGFSPRNFSHDFDGAVAADKALIRSLNVPAVHMLREYRYEKFYSLLQELGMSTLNKPADHYGLSLILGGAEGTLWDITGMYASMSRSLGTYFQYAGKERYKRTDFHQPTYRASQLNTDEISTEKTETSVLSAASIYFTFDALKEVFRPGEETGWRYFASSRNIAWKTGTSFGFRDGWAVGVTPEVAVGVWIGNADGEGRPGLTGSETAAPVMFEIFSQLQQKAGWFDVPNAETREVIVCTLSGHRATSHCTELDTVLVPVNGLRSTSCPYHRIVHLSQDMKFQVHDKCVPLSAMTHVKWFVLPPVQEFYYRSLHQRYKALPPFRADCENSLAVVSMDMVYPKDNTKLFIPRELDGNPGRSVFELAHRDPKIKVFWHLDGKFVGSTTTVHHLPLNPSPGRHVLTLVDENGLELRRTFEIVSKL